MGEPDLESLLEIGGSMSRRSVAPAVFALSLWSAPVVAGDIAVVVHSDVTVENVRLADRPKIMLGDRQFWANPLREH
jgi:hypothetical protein